MKKGFTLVELLVVLAILAILSVSMVPSFRSAQRSQSFQKSIQIVETVLGEGLSRARSSRALYRVSGSADTSAFMFDICEPSVEQEILCDNTKQEKYELSSRVRFEDDFEVLFAPPYGRASGSEKIELIDDDGKRAAIVIYSASGLITRQ